jgi:hypothetical protein
MSAEIPEAEGQDQAETFDEDNLNLDEAGAPPTEMRTFEELPEVLDVTRAAGDSDDDDALIGEELDDDEIVELEADAELSDPEDDDLADRMPEARKAAAEEARPGEGGLSEDELRERRAAAERAS